MPWYCELSAILYWQTTEDEIMAWHVDALGSPTYEASRLTTVDGSGLPYWGCQNCGIEFGTWAEVEEHLASDAKEDDQRGRWKHHGG